MAETFKGLPKLDREKRVEVKGLHRAPVMHSISHGDVVNRMFENIKEFQLPKFKISGTVSICGYGPSLKDTWKDINKSYPVVSTSGAHDFLIERGIVPQYHVECDARIHKLDFLQNPHKDVHYLIASTCHPEIFRKLKNYRVTMWHPITNAFEEQIKLLKNIEPDAHLISGGSNAGQRALLLMFHIGHKIFHLHGIDCSYRENETWAGKHSGDTHLFTPVICNDKKFLTSDIMYNACQDFVELMQSNFFHGSEVFVHGDGLLAERIRLAETDMQKAVHDWVRKVA